MTVSTLNNSNNFTGDDASTSFAFTFDLQQSADMLVYLAGVLQSTSSYTVNPTGGTYPCAGGTVVFNTAPVNAVVGLLYRQVALTQLTVIPPESFVPEVTLTNMTDKLTMAVQQLSALISTGVIPPVGSGISSNITGAPNYLIGFDSTGLIIESLNPVTVFQTAFPGAGSGNVVGQTSATRYATAYADSTTGKLINYAGPGSAGQVWTSNGNAAPSMQTLPQSTPIDQFRAYLVTGQPFADGSSSGNGTIYVGPLPTGNRVTVDNGSGSMSVVSLAEISLALTLTSGSAYSLFMVNTAGVQTLEVDVWTNTTTPLTYARDGAGRLCKTGATNKLLVAEFYAAATNKIFNWTGSRHLFNFYNQFPAPLFAQDTTGNWSGSGSIEASHSNTTDGVGRFSLFTGSIPTPILINCMQDASGSAGLVVIAGIGINSTSAFTQSGLLTTGTAGGSSTIACSYATILSVGLNYAQRLDNCSNANTLYGGAVSTGQTNQISAMINS